MKTTETLTSTDPKNLKSNSQNSIAIEADCTIRPLRSLRPMKSMARIKSVKPARIELASRKRKQIRGL